MDWRKEIKTLRKKHRLTQAQFAELIGIGLSTVKSWEASEEKSWSARPPAVYQASILSGIEAEIEAKL